MKDFIIGQRGFLLLLVQTFTPRPTPSRGEKELNSDNSMVTPGKGSSSFPRNRAGNYFPPAFSRVIE